MATNALDSSSELPLVHTKSTETTASFSGALNSFYRGIVIDRNDPNNQGRVLVSLPHIYGNIPQNELPWVYPATAAWNTSQTSNGSSSNSSGTSQSGGAVSVPPLGSSVLVGFEGGDHRYPFYMGSGFGHPGFTDNVPKFSFAANGNSPDNYSFSAPNGSSVRIDNRAGTQKILAITPQGDYVCVSETGAIEIWANHTVSIKAATRIEIQCPSDVFIKGGSTLLYATGDVVVQGANSVNINSDSAVNIQASKVSLNCNNSQSPTTQVQKIDTTPTFNAS
jgi:hypothetical protein